MKTKKMTPWTPITPEGMVAQVMGAKIKELTGPYVYTFSVLGRTVGVNAASATNFKSEARKALTPPQRMRDAMCRSYNIMFPGQEAILDARKNLDTLEALYQVAEALQGVVNGEALEIDPFQPFLTPDQMATFQHIVNSVGQGLHGCRRTAYGTVVAAGKGLERSIGTLIRNMLKQGVKAEDTLQVLQRDALGEEFCFIARKEGAAPPEELKAPEPTITVSLTAKKFTEVVESLTVNGQQVFHDVQFRKMPGGQFDVLATMLVTWQEDAGKIRAFKVHWQMPAVEKRGEDGHARITPFVGGERFFRPRFMMMEGQLFLQDWKGYIMEALVEGIRDLTRSKGKVSQFKAEMKLQAAVRKAIQELPDSEPVADLVHQYEFEVVVPEMDEITAKWSHAERLLSMLSRCGFDLCTTSKNEPGTIVTKATELGVPQYLLDLSPFARYQDAKRRPETREIKGAVKLAKPTGLTCKIPGQVNNFDPYVTELWTAWFDCNANVFARRDGTRFCHDTILCTRGAVEKLAISEVRTPCRNEEEVNENLEMIRSRFGDTTKVRILANDEDKGDGLIVQRFVIEVSGTMEDVGKMKAVCSAVKGIPNVLPVRLHTVIRGEEIDIDVVVPRDTVVRKKDLGAALYAAAARLDIREIDPNRDLQDVANEIREGLEAECGNRDGLVPIYATYPGEEPVLLGEAFVGKLPFFRPSQTNFQNFKIRKGRHGISLHTHAMVMVGDCKYRTPKFVQHQWTETVAVLEQCGKALADLRYGRTEVSDAIPLVDEIEEGKVTCHRCEGSGEFTLASGNTGVCFTCKGEGVVSPKKRHAQYSRR